MQNMPDMSEMLRLARTPEGKRFLSMLQTVDPSVLNAASEQMKQGNFEAARTALSAVLNTPEGKSLLNSLGGNHGGTGR